MLLKEYRKLPWPRNIWSTILRKEVSEKELPEDWEQALKYIFEARLDAKKAEILRYYFQGGMTFQEIGDIYGLTLETIRQHASKAIRTMRHPSWRVFLIYGLEKGKAVLAEERTVAKRQRQDGRSVVAKDCRIETLDLSVRTFNCLKRAGINTVEQLVQCSDEDLARVRNLGTRSLQEINDRLASIREGCDKKPEGEEDSAADLISRKALLEAIENIDWHSVNKNLVLHEGARDEECAFVRYADVESAIKAAPVVQVNPVVYGRWIITESIPTIEKTVECSACRCKGYYPKALWGAIRLTDYCPACGAKMEAYKCE